MKSGVALFLRGALVLVGIGALAFLLAEPHFEGRNAHATLFAIYFKDPFLAYAYVGSIPFFVGLYQAFKVLGHTGRNKEFPPSTIRSVRTIKHCAIALIGFVAGAEAIIMLSDSDDRAGGVFMGIVILFASSVVAIAMTLLERALQKAMEMKSGNDLMV
jgi:hypothetical protein